MIRPCTLPAHWKQTEPFDAMKIRTFLCRPVPYHTQTKKKTEYRIELFINDSDSIFSPATTDHKELERYKFEAITTIAEALNAPVEAKDEVLKDLPKDAKVWKVWDDGLELCFIRWFNKRWAYNVVDAHSTMTGGGCDVAFKEKELCSADRIKPDDPKTAEYLRQFTLDGVRIKEGG